MMRLQVNDMKQAVVRHPKPALAIRILLQFWILVALLIRSCGVAEAYQCGDGYALDPAIPVTIGGSVITTSADVPVNGWIGDWSAYSKTYRNWWCYASNGDNLRPKLQGSTQFASPSSLVLDGVTYAVFQTGVAGLGVVFHWHPIYGTADASGNYTGTVYEPVTDVPLTNAYTSAAPPWPFQLPSQYTDIGIAISARYVKIGTITAGSTLVARSNTVIGTATIQYNGITFGTNNITLTQLKSTFPVLGCTPTTNVPVSMGIHATSEFKGIGTTAGKRSFTLPLAGCPAGMGAIIFSLHPVSGSVGASTNGIAQLTPGTGVATGIGLQISTTGSGTVVGFDVDTRFDGYTGAAGNYQIGLDAAYYQTQVSVTAGSANSLIEFTIQYQ
ncbi:major type 1 subunit fimbrin (pilin) [Pseudomonas sp. 3296]|uniref:fimbrial protein n=1 Tax=Pseudomonas sp. 3296 TaxID=2817753 RepID=UPI002860836F|nr:fimbrial protein [Pseudomonas sp. 3296]MDR6917903.1 major type 1 subunit fimbrin (pilin) [Pseudomonas sp. 3296]